MNARRMVRAVLATTAVALALVASPAHAADGVSVGHTEVSDDGTVSLLLDVDPQVSSATPDLDSIKVSVDGHPVSATATAVKAGQVTRTTILTLDTSESMAGARIREAEAAAKAFLDAAPRDVRVGLITFSDKVHTVIAPTTDRAKLADAIDAIRLTRDTRVYDAVVAAVNLAGDDGSRDVLLLTDGRDTGGGSTLEQATAAATEHGTAVDVVALDQTAQDRSLLAHISKASSGEVIQAADADALRTVFKAEADALASQLLIQFPRPEGGVKEVELAVSLTAGGTTYDDSAFVSLDTVADTGPKIVDSGRALVGKGVMLGGAAALALGLAAILAVVLLGANGPTVSQKRVSAYLGETATNVNSANLKDVRCRVHLEDRQGRLRDPAGPAPDGRRADASLPPSGSCSTRGSPSRLPSWASPSAADRSWCWGSSQGSSSPRSSSSSSTPAGSPPSRPSCRRR